MDLRYVLTYLFLLSFGGFLIMGIDKRKAKRGLWRVPEKSIFLIALLGGGVGTWLGMQIFRHKTKHWYFKFGLPAISMLQLALLAAWVYWNTFLR